MVLVVGSVVVVLVVHIVIVALMMVGVVGVGVAGCCARVLATRPLLLNPFRLLILLTSGVGVIVGLCLGTTACACARYCGRYGFYRTDSKLAVLLCISTVVIVRVVAIMVGLLLIYRIVLSGI